MKIFIVKIFSWFAKTRKLRKTTKIKKKETRSIFYNENNGQHILLTWLHNAASYSCFGQKGLSF